MPLVWMKIPSSNMTNDIFLKGAAKQPADIFLGTGSVLRQTVRAAIICRPRMRKPVDLMAQGHPVL